MRGSFCFGPRMGSGASVYKGAGVSSVFRLPQRYSKFGNKNCNICQVVVLIGMSKKAAWKEFREGALEIKIYKLTDGYQAAWYEGGHRKRKFKARAGDIESFAKATLAALARGISCQTPDAAKDLAYLHQLQARMGEVPVHLAVDFYLQNNRTKKIVDARVADLLPQFQASLVEHERSPNYTGEMDQYLAPFAKTFPGIIREITTDQIDHYMTRLSQSLNSRKHFLAACVTFFRWARDVKKALPPGPTEPEIVTKPDPKPQPIRIYTPAQMALLLRYAKNEEIPLIVLGGFSGLRVSEITGERTAHGSLQCEDILFDEGAVHVIQKVQDNSVDRYAPLLPSAAAHLSHLRGKTGPVWDTTVTPFHVLSGLLARIRAAGHEVPRLRNGFRRSYISYRTAITRDPAKVADECNTSPEKIRKNYRRPGLESVAHAWFSLRPRRRAISRAISSAPSGGN